MSEQPEQQEQQPDQPEQEAQPEQQEQEEEPDQQDAGGTVYDAPNQEAVGQPPPWVEGTGGTPGTLEQQQAEGEQEETDLDSMTKDQLLAYAQSRGISPANAGMNKDEIRASINEAET